MRSKGKWLDESDSDEEPAEPVGISSSLDPGFNRRTSGVSISSTSTSPTSSPIEAPVATLSPILAEGTSKRTWKRRHSPTPSTHTHTAIDILSTPLLDRMPSINSSRAASPTPGHGITESGGNDKMPFLSVYRAHMMIMTVHCILAVDFTVFPRWQGKCEDFGTSLVGLSFVIRKSRLSLADGCRSRIIRLLIGCCFRTESHTTRTWIKRDPIGNSGTTQIRCDIGLGSGPCRHGQRV